MSKLMERILIFFGVGTILMLEAWEFCNKPEIGEKVCRAGKSHFMCGEIQAQAGRWVTVEVKAPPMTRKIKRYFLEFFNSLRNNISSGAYTLSNGQTFPIAARMREVIWDNELEFMMQTWVRAGKESKLDCIGSQRLNFVYTKLFTSPQKYKLPFFKIVDLTLLAYTKNMDGISNTKEVQSYGTAMRNSKADAFITTIQERMSRIGCSAAVGLNGTERPTGPIIPYVYFVACALDFENKGSQVIYKVHPTDSASECDYWGATRSKKYPNLCTNTGEIFPYVEELVPPV